MAAGGGGANRFPRYADTYLMIGTGDESAPAEQGWHRPRVPYDLPDTFESFGLCTCVHCKQKQRANSVSVGWETHRQPLKDMATGATFFPATHSETWRSLSWHGGDEFADWICMWCDDQPNPREWADAIVAVCDLHWEALRARGAERTPGSPHTRTKVYAFIIRSLMGLVESEP